MRVATLVLVLALLPGRSSAQATLPTEAHAAAPVAIWPMIQAGIGGDWRAIWNDEEQEAPSAEPRPNTGLPTVPEEPRPCFQDCAVSTAEAIAEASQPEREHGLRQSWLHCKEALA